MIPATHLDCPRRTTQTAVGCDSGSNGIQRRLLETSLEHSGGTVHGSFGKWSPIAISTPAGSLPSSGCLRARTRTFAPRLRSSLTTEPPTFPVPPVTQNLHRVSIPFRRRPVSSSVRRSMDRCFCRILTCANRTWGCTHCLREDSPVHLAELFRRR